MAYDNTNRGALFKNDKKTKDSDPAYKGSIDIDGVEYWISSWLNTSGQGVKYMSLEATPKEQAPQRAPARQAPSHDAARARQLAPRQDERDQDVPF
jgi:hypothetical protein